MPAFECKDGFISIRTPYFVKAIYLSEDLFNLFKFEKLHSLTKTGLHCIVKRTQFEVPNFMRGTYYYHPDDYEGTQYQFNTEKLFINTPCRQIINYLGDGKTTTTTKTSGGDTVVFQACLILKNRYMTVFVSLHKK